MRKKLHPIPQQIHIKMTTYKHILTQAFHI